MLSKVEVSSPRDQNDQPDSAPRAKASRAHPSRRAQPRRRRRDAPAHRVWKRTSSRASHGLPADEARRRAAIAFGGVDRHAEAHHDARGVRWLEEIAQDVRYATRALRRSPAFTITATLVLAFGIGASTAIFSAVDAVLVSRLPYPDDDRLVRIYQQNSPTNRFGLSVVDYQAIVAQQRSFTAVASCSAVESVTLSVDDRVRRANIAAADAGFFSALGVRAPRSAHRRERHRRERVRGRRLTRLRRARVRR